MPESAHASARRKNSAKRWQDCSRARQGSQGLFEFAGRFSSGKYRSNADLKGARAGGVKQYMNERRFRILNALDAIAQAHGAKPAEVALAWRIAREGVTAPIASATTVEQVDSLVRATRLELTAGKVRSLDSASG